MEVICLFLWVLGHFTSVRAHGRHVVDLTHFVSSSEVCATVTSNFKGTTRGDNSSKVRLSDRPDVPSELGGTCIEAPSNVIPDGVSIDKVPLDKLMGAGVVIDLSLSARLNPDTQLQISDVIEWEEWNGPIPDNAILAVNTGWGRYWPNATRILGTANHKDPSSFKYPGVHLQTARWLVESRPQVVALAIDTPTVDFGRDREFSAQKILAAAGIVVIHNVARLDQLPPSGCLIFAVPMKVKGDGRGLVRLFAILHQHHQKERTHFHLTTNLETCDDISNAVDRNYIYTILTLALTSWCLLFKEIRYQ